MNRFILLLLFFLFKGSLLAQTSSDVAACLRACLETPGMKTAFTQEWGELRPLYLRKREAPGIGNRPTDDALNQLAAADFQGLTPLALTAPEDWLRAIHVNLSAPLLLTQACLPLLKRAEDAAVVFVEEPLAQVGRAYWGGYGVAKHGLAGLVGVLRHEYEGTSVRVVALQPGPMRTPLRQRAWSAEDPAQWPNPDAYAPACVHLLSGAASPAPDDGGVLLVRH